MEIIIKSVEEWYESKDGPTVLEKIACKILIERLKRIRR